MTLKGTVTITRTTHGNGTHDMRIRFRENDSRVEFATMKLSLEDFSKALTGLAEVEGDLEVRGLALVGKVAQSKVEIVKGTGERDEDDIR